MDDRMYAFRDADKYFKNEYFVHAVFKTLVDHTNEFVNTGNKYGHVNKFMAKELNENEYIIFSIKDFSVFKVKFEPQRMMLLMKDGILLTFSIKATPDIFELAVTHEAKNLTPRIPEREMLDTFIRIIKKCCNIERKLYIPSINEARKIHTIRSKAKIKIYSKESNTCIAWTNKDKVSLRLSDDVVYVTINGVEHYIAPGIYVNTDKAKWALETYNRIEDTIGDAYYNDSVELNIDGLIDTSYVM